MIYRTEKPFGFQHGKRVPEAAFKRRPLPTRFFAVTAFYRCLLPA
jgi:hypothetical protein